MTSVSEIVDIRRLKAPRLGIFNGLAVEVGRISRAVMLIDDLDDRIRQSLLLGKLYTVFRVLRNDRNALHNRKAVMGINAAVLVLGEILRILELADIVIICSNLAKECICTDCFCS